MVLVGLTDPHVPAVTPVAHVTVQLTVVLLEPVTVAVNGCVRLVMGLAAVGLTAIVTPEEVLFPQPETPSATATASNEKSFHHLIPALPRFFDR